MYFNIAVLLIHVKQGSFSQIRLLKNNNECEL